MSEKKEKNRGLRKILEFRDKTFLVGRKKK